MKGDGHDHLLGVDGCRGGWLAAALRSPDSAPEAAIYRTFRDLLDAFPRAPCIAIDIPIGLPRNGARACDEMARELVGPRYRSVFPTPFRGTLAADSPGRARELQLVAPGGETSIPNQAYELLGKIREVDFELQQRPGLVDVIREVHPELSFWKWAGSPLAFAKKDPEGMLERSALIASRWPGRVSELRKTLPKRGWALDDLHDAFAALWTALRIVDGTAIQIPDTPEFDQLGISMRMFA